MLGTGLAATQAAVEIIRLKSVWGQSVSVLRAWRSALSGNSWVSVCQLRGNLVSSGGLVGRGRLGHITERMRIRAR